eukprot:gene7380-11702_t
MSTKQEINKTKNNFEELFKEFDDEEQDFLTINHCNNFLTFLMMESEDLMFIKNKSKRILASKFIFDKSPLVLRTIRKIPAEELASVKEFKKFSSLLEHFIKNKNLIDLDASLNKKQIKEKLSLLHQNEEIPLAFLNLVKTSQNLHNFSEPTEKKLMEDGVANQREHSKLQNAQKIPKKLNTQNNENMFLNRLKEQNDFLISTSEKKNQKILSLQQITKKLYEKISTLQSKQQEEFKAAIKMQQELKTLQKERDENKTKMEQEKVEKTQEKPKIEITFDEDKIEKNEEEKKITKKKSYFSNFIKPNKSTGIALDVISTDESYSSINENSKTEEDELMSKKSIECSFDETLKNETYVPSVSTTEKSEITKNESVEKYIENDDLEKFKNYINETKIDLRRKIGKKSLIHIATLSGSYSIVEFLIQSGINVDIVDANQRTCLHLASNIGNRDICILLLGSGAKVNSRDCYGYSPLILSLKHHYFDLAKDLLLFGADLNFKRDNGMTAVHDATVNNDELMFDWLLQQPNIKLNLKDQIGQTPFLRSIEKCKPSFIFRIMTTKLIDKNVIDSSGRNLFHLACRHRRDDFLEYLNQFDNVIFDSFSKFLLLKDRMKNQTPLHLAVESGKLKVVEKMMLLISRLNEDFNVKDNYDKTPYDIACTKEFQEKFEEANEIRSFLETKKKMKKKKKNSAFNK